MFWVKLNPLRIIIVVLVVHLFVLGPLHAFQGSSIKYPSLSVKVELALGQIMQNSLKIYITVMFIGLKKMLNALVSISIVTRC